MFIITIILSSLLAAVFALGGAGRVMQQPMMEENRTRLNITPQRWQMIGALEIVGALGVVIGLWVPAIGLAAAVGLGAMMIGAIITHLRNGDGPAGWVPPLIVLALLVGYVVTRAATM